jgi:5-oxoprolinase (ATP-hydrolysing) subunit A
MPKPSTTLQALSNLALAKNSAIAKPTIDLNCDMGESFGVYTIGDDAALMKYASSVNIACGFHSGDPSVMRHTVELALENGVAIGAHPGLPDLEGFGRRMMQISAREVFDMTLYQISALSGIATASGGKMTHVKPHGALYNMLATSAELSAACAEAIFALNPTLVFVGLANSLMMREGERIGLRTASEGFADRTYQADGTLTPRTKPNALITSSGEAAAQAVSIVLNNRARTADDGTVHVRAQTICLHGDNPDSVRFARAVVRGLRSAGIDIRALV